MKSSEFTAEDNDIAFLKLIIDRTWNTIKTDAQKKTAIDASKEKTKIDDIRNKKLIKHRTSNDTQPLSAKNADRPLRDQIPNTFRS